MITGSVNLNGITDADLVMILQQKEKGQGLIFNPNQLQPFVPQMRPGVPHNPGIPQQSAQRNTQIYNNCSLNWQSEAGLKTVYSILHKIIHGHEHEAAQN